MDAPLGDQDVVVPGVDEADGAVERLATQRGLGLPCEVADSGRSRPAVRLDLAADDAGQGPRVPRVREQFDPVPLAYEMPAEVRDVRLGAASGGVHPDEVQGQSHA